MLQKMLTNAGYDTLSYQMADKRGTYCLGVRTNNIGLLFSNVLKTLEVNTNLEELSSAFRMMRIDNLGTHSILYFPTIPYQTPNICQYEYLPDEDGTVYTCGSDYRVENINGYFICGNHQD